MDARWEEPAQGATLHADGATFAVSSQHAEAIDLCLFDPTDPDRETARVRLERGARDLWSVDVPGVAAGDLYGYRVHGPHEPRHGHRFDPRKLLVDPWARATTGPHRWHPSQQPGGGDSAAHSPRAVVIDPAFAWGADRRPATPWSETVLYEAHVKGLTALHPDVPPEHRGRYLGVASEPIVAHLRHLGVTAIQLLPVPQAFDEAHLVRGGRTNYWGYAPLAPFAPDGRFASGTRGQQVTEFREMVRRLHGAGIEVLLDVVFNHTAEGADDGPVLSLRGLDNAGFYRLRPDDPSHAIDWTGCGNTLDARQPMVRRWIVDCLSWWARDMHVDGFRFDLAVCLDRSPGFLEDLAAAPALRGLKLIAEPWDLGPDGYRLGRFPAPWVEWNDRFRDAARRAWRGDAGLLPELATRLSGSSDVFPEARGPLAGVNYVACHDGFTLRDLCSYRRKRNRDNGEDNRDGTDANSSEPWGPEGPSAEPEVQRRRDRAARALLATVALAQGVPMIAQGDEMGRSQGGNNNAYCQDGPLTWVRWDLDERAADLLAFTARAFEVRRAWPALRRARFLRGAGGRNPADVRWFSPDGDELDGAGWGGAAGLGARLEGIDGEPALLLLLNPSPSPLTFELPAEPLGWHAVLDSARPPGARTDTSAVVPAHTLRLLAGGR